MSYHSYKYYGSSCAKSSQCNDYESSYSGSRSYPIKIFNVCRIQKQNLLLMRNKVPKVFWIHKYKRSSLRKASISPRESSVYSDTPVRRVVGGIYKIERFPHLKKRINVKANDDPKILNRICNEYSDKVTFKIERVKKQLIKPFALKRYPSKKVVDIDSASTKRSSRESSKHKVSCLNTNPILHIEPIIMARVEQDESPIKLVPEILDQENDLLALNRHQNEELRKEIQTFKFQDHLNDELELLNPEVQPLNIPIEFESMSSYHEDEFDEAYAEIERQPVDQLLNSYKAPLRPRGVSVCNNDFSVTGVNENNSFLFGNERETPNFEPFVTGKLFSNNFAFDHHKPL